MVRNTGPVLGVVAAWLLLLASQAAAQPARDIAVEGSGGYAGFVDDATIDHSMVAGALRVYLTPRLSVGPEIVYMRGPRSDRDFVVTGNLVFDLVRPQGTRPRLVTPYLLAGGGWFQHSDRFFNEVFRSNEGAFTGGGGARIRVGNGVYLAPEYRIGWELHYRIGLTVGWAPQR